MIARAAVGLALVLVVLGGDSVSAQAPGQAADAVRLRIPDCVDVRGEDVRALIALELAPRLRVAGEEESQPVLTASLRCDHGTIASIAVAEPADAAPLRVELDLAKSAPAARTRLLALSVAELIATRRLERRAPAAQTAAATHAEPAAAAQAAAAPHAAPATAEQAAAPHAEPTPDVTAPDAPARAGFRLWIGPGLARAASPATTLLGASAGVARTLGMFALSGELQALFGQAELRDANVAVQAFSAGVALAPQLTHAALAFSAGAGVRAGYVKLAADAQRPELTGDTFAGAWFGPMALAALDVDIARPGSLRFGIEAGYVLRGVAGQDAHAQTLLALRGVWVSALVAVALAM